MSHLKYLNVMIKVSTKHRLFIAPGQSISLICIVVKIRYSWTKHKFNLFWAEFILGIVLVLPNVFIVSSEICKVSKGDNKGKCNGPLF